VQGHTHQADALVKQPARTKTHQVVHLIQGVLSISKAFSEDLSNCQRTGVDDPQRVGRFEHVILFAPFVPH
jgi:hypothetical protein